MRGYVTEPDIYFGAPGALIQLPWPRGGMVNPVDRPVYDFVSGSGNHRVSSLIGTSRSYALTWAALHQSTYDRMTPYWLGHNGPGPWALIDPSRPNLLTANQSAACGQWRNTTDWLVGTGGGSHGVISANKTAAFIHRPGGSRSLKWTFATGLATTPILNLPHPYAPWFGVPVVPGLSYSWSFWCTPDGVVDASITAGAAMTFYDAAGGVISTITETQTANTAWTQRVIIDTAPAGAAFVLPSVRATGATIANGGSLYIDEPILEQTDTINPWAPGTGVLPVAVMVLSETIPFDAMFRLQPSLSLREVR